MCGCAETEKVLQKDEKVVLKIVPSDICPEIHAILG